MVYSSCKEGCNNKKEAIIKVENNTGLEYRIFVNGVWKKDVKDFGEFKVDVLPQDYILIAEPKGKKAGNDYTEIMDVKACETKTFTFP